MNRLQQVTAGLFLTIAAASSHATVVYSSTGGGLASPTAIMTFDGSTLGANAAVTNEFTGATFSGSSAGSPRFAPCEADNAGWGSQFLVDNTYIGTYGPNCTGNGTEDDLTIAFDTTVSELSVRVAPS
jgi:hypothetical protein